MKSICHAVQCAIGRLAPSIRTTGTVSLFAAFSNPITGGGRGARAALAIGFLTLLKGEALIQGITIPGHYRDDRTR